VDSAGLAAHDAAAPTAARSGGNETLTGREVHVVRYPTGELRESDFRVVEVDVDDPRDGEVLVRNTWTSVDAAHRLRLREKAPPGYFAAFGLGHAMDGIATVGEVVASRADGFEVGDTVRHAAGWRDYALIEAGKPALGGVGTLMRVDTDVAAPEAYLGALGGSGLTAYVGLFDVAGLREGDVVWVSAAAGSVGSLVAQMAKIRGHRVVGSAGSDDKVSYLRDELGLDAAFNYKAGPLAELLRTAAPDGIDVYFDNVGGDHLEAAIGALRRRGRIAMCGAISEYDASRPAPGPGNLFLAVANDLTLRGFRGSSHVNRMAEMMREVGAWLREGRIRYRQTVVDGLEHAPQALARLLRGDTTGKTLVRIAAASPRAVRTPGPA
jgi:NADPH-dependent curcumin reductase CurA